MKTTIISIHAPGKGSDDTVVAVVVTGIVFQSTLPVKGATAKVNKYSILFLSNIISFARI